MPTIEITDIQPTHNTLEYIGSVQNVLDATIPEALKNRRFLAKNFRYGFELASPQGIYNLGECILLNDIVYSSRTDDTREERSPLMWGPEFVTSGIFLIPHTAQCSATVRYFSFDEPLTFTKLYADIYASLNKPFAVAGCVELEKIRAQSINHPPIDGDEIFEHQEYYFHEEEYVQSNISIAVVGVVSDPNDAALQALNEKLKAVLYYNPFNGKHDLSSHTHALILTHPIIDIDSIKPHNAKEVMHLMEDSMIRYANLKIFTIDDLVEHGY